MIGHLTAGLTAGTAPNRLGPLTPSHVPSVAGRGSVSLGGHLTMRTVAWRSWVSPMSACVGSWIGSFAGRLAACRRDGKHCE